MWGERAGDWAELLENPDRPWLGPAYELVLERLVRPGTRLLDVGCGSGRFCVLADRARATRRPTCGRATSYAADIVAAFQEAARVLRPGGHVALTAFGRPER